MTDEVFIVKESARARVETSLIPMTVDQVKTDAMLMYAVGMDLQSFLSARSLLPPFPPEGRTRDHKSKAARAARRKQRLS